MTMTVTVQSILGLPVHDLSMTNAKNAILQLYNDYRIDNQPRYIATVNVDFLTNTWGWVPGNVRHPELLDILRNTDLITADGMPLVWLSRLLGTPLAERVTGADLLWLLAEVCAENNLSLFILGAQEELVSEASSRLHESYPQLNIAGTLSPFIQTGGKLIVDSEELDDSIVEKINESKADVLFICMGNPKQEIWFQRVRSKLKVPISIGIGGALNFVVGKFKRAPLWARELGLEWVFRLMQEPRRLWRRYVRGGLKLLSLATPLILLQSINRKLYGNSPHLPIEIRAVSGKDERGKRSYRLTLPSHLNQAEMLSLKKWMNKDFRCNKIILDFSQVQTIDSTGLGILQELVRLVDRLEVELLSENISRRLSILLKIHQVENLFLQPCSCTKKASSLFTVHHYETFHKLSVKGCLKKVNFKRDEFLTIMTALEKKPVLIDLGQCSFIDNVGLAHLLKIRRRLIVNSQAVVFYNCSKEVKKFFKIAELENSIAIAENQASAEKMLEKHEILISPLQRA